MLVTSLLRTRISPRLWRAVHWAGYVCWPVALVHGLGTGTDGAARWVLAVTAACALAVAAAGVWRLAAGWPARAGLRAGGRGRRPSPSRSPSRAGRGRDRCSPGWARRAGTPSGLLARSAGNATAVSPGSPGGTSGGSAVQSGSAAFPAVPFQAPLTGTVTSAPGAVAGNSTVTLAMADGNAVRLKIVISGPAVQGGVEMTASSVTVGPASAPARYTGHVVVLDGSVMQATVSGAGQRLLLAIDLTGQTGTTATGTLTAQRAGE